MTIPAKALQRRLAMARLQNVKPPKSAVRRFSCLSLFHFLDCTQLALGASVPNPQGEEQQGQPDCNRTHSRVESRVSQLRRKVGWAIEYVSTKVMDPQDRAHNPGPVTLLGRAQFPRGFTPIAPFSRCFYFQSVSVWHCLGPVNGVNEATRFKTLVYRKHCYKALSIQVFRCEQTVLSIPR